MIAGIFYFIKMYYTPFLVINAFLSSFLVYLFFVQYIEINRRINMDSWEFFIDGVKYTISCDGINRDGSIIVSNIALNRVYQLVVRMKEELFSLETILYILLP